MSDTPDIVERLTNGPLNLDDLDEAAATITALRSQVADLTAQRDAMSRALAEIVNMYPNHVRCSIVARTALALCQQGGGE